MKKHIPRGAPPLLLTLLIIGIAACRKDDPPPQDCPPDLPCATQYGANTFGCYIDGVPWVAKVEPDVLDPTSHPFEVSYDETGYGDYNNNYLRVIANYYGDTQSYLGLQFKPIKYTGKIDMRTVDFSYVIYRDHSTSYFIDTNFIYSISILKLDTSNRVLAGMFNFTMTNQSDTIQITDGRFDVKYSPE